MIIQRVNMVSSKNMMNSAEKLSKINFSQNTKKSDVKDSFSTKFISYDPDTIEVYGGFVC